MCTLDLSSQMQMDNMLSNMPIYSSNIERLSIKLKKL